MLAFHSKHLRRAIPLTAALALIGLQARAAAPAAKYYFQLHEVKSAVPLDEEVRKYAGEALKEDLSARPEWASDIGGVTEPEAVVAELQKRKLRGFDVIVKIADVKKEMKDPNPGQRRKRLAVTVTLEVLGTTLPGEKLAFSGDGEASADTEVVESRMESQANELTKLIVKDAVHQAVDQAVLKLGMPKSAPMNESKHKRKSKKG